MPPLVFSFCALLVHPDDLAAQRRASPSLIPGGARQLSSCGTFRVRKLLHPLRDTCNFRLTGEAAVILSRSVSYHLAVSSRLTKA